MDDTSKNNKFIFALGTQSQRSKVEIQPREEPKVHDFIQGIDSTGKILGGTRKKPPPLTIPLIDSWTNKYKNYEYQNIVKMAKEGICDTDETVTTPAVPQEQEVKDNSIDEDSYKYIMSLPPLLRNRPPGLDKIEDEKSKFLYDVQCRPDAVDDDAYERMPLEKFGEAMLRGMGWRKGMPIGKNSQHVQPVIQFVKLPPRLGLSATPKFPEKKKEGLIKPGESRDPKPLMALPKTDGRVRYWREIDEPLKPLKKPFYSGCPVYIRGGIHEGIKATVEIKQGLNAIVILPSDEKVVVPLNFLQELESIDEIVPLSSERQSRSHQKKEKRDKKLKDKSKKKKKSKDKTEKHKKKHHKKRKYSSSSDSSDRPDKRSRIDVDTKKIPSPPREPTWITQDIRVKIRSKSLWEGRYYCKYAWIVDILSENRCTIQVEDSGTLLEDVRQSDLETVVPAKGTVKIVRGKFIGELGTVFDKNAAKSIVHVQLEDDMEIHTMDYDDVAQFRNN